MTILEMVTADKSSTNFKSMCVLIFCCQFILAFSFMYLLSPHHITNRPIQSMEFSRPEYQSGQPFPSPGDLPNPGMKPRSPVLKVDSLPAEPQGKPKIEFKMAENLPLYAFFTPSVKLWCVSSEINVIIRQPGHFSSWFHLMTPPGNVYHCCE